jgi:diguanylate cyclase (GGDEF)-like protein
MEKADPKSSSLHHPGPEFYQELLGRLEDPVFVKNNQHQWIFANEAFKELIGCNDLIGKTDADLLPADQVEKFYDGDNYVIRTQSSLTQEEEIGEGVYALVKKIPITLPDDTPGLFGIIFDISEYRNVQLEVEKLRLATEQSRTDPLTGLANRRHLETYYQQFFSGSDDQAAQSRSLLHIDLDHFKEINDRRGHQAGDAVLVHIADTLRNCARHNEFIARIGGDEFVVVSDGAGVNTVVALAQRIIDDVSAQWHFDNEEVALSVSIGIATDVPGKLTLNQLLKDADIALYRAKSNGRGRFEQFTSTIRKEHNELRRQRDELRLAFEQQQFFPVYQPQFNTRTLEIVGVEALARWSHPQRGVLLPCEFLDLAVSERRLVDLDRIILNAALEDAKSLRAAGTTMPTLSVNVSSQSLASSEFVDSIKALGPFPIRICFELVESMLLDEPSGVVSTNLQGLREMGISLDIDDFGSGHASLLGMLEARPDRVKIDKRLVIPMIESKKHRELVKSIVQIAESLGMDTVAEGVESEPHRELLQQLGCQCVQGFGFARPMPVDELKTLLLRQAA